MTFSPFRRACLLSIWGFPTEGFRESRQRTRTQQGLWGRQGGCRAQRSKIPELPQPNPIALSVFFDDL